MKNLTLRGGKSLRHYSKLTAVDFSGILKNDIDCFSQKSVKQLKSPEQ